MDAPLARHSLNSIRCALLAGSMLTVLPLAGQAADEGRMAASAMAPTLLAQAPAIDPQTGKPLPKGVAPKGPPPQAQPPAPPPPPAPPRQVQPVAPPPPPAPPRQVQPVPPPPSAPKQVQPVPPPPAPKQVQPVPPPPSVLPKQVQPVPPPPSVLPKQVQPVPPPQGTQGSPSGPPPGGLPQPKQLQSQQPQQQPGGGFQPMQKNIQPGIPPAAGTPVQPGQPPQGARQLPPGTPGAPVLPQQQPVTVQPLPKSVPGSPPQPGGTQQVVPQIQPGGVRPLPPPVAGPLQQQPPAAGPLPPPVGGQPVAPQQVTPQQVTPQQVAPQVLPGQQQLGRPQVPQAPAAGPTVVNVDHLRSQRQERRDASGAVVIVEPGQRTIVRQGNTVIIRQNETERFRRFGGEPILERRGAEHFAVVNRPGYQIVTVTDADGRLLRRMRRGPDGREVILLENRHYHGPGPGAVAVGVGVGLAAGVLLGLAAPTITIPRERYIVDVSAAPAPLLYETLQAPPLVAIERPYSIDEIRYNVALRDRMRRVDIDSITFDSGSWEVTPEQQPRLAVVADAVRRVVAANPNEIFMVEGHTDAVGADVDNLSLSDRRAESVAVILTDAYQIPPENLVTQGYGEQHLKIPSPGPVRENRRVTVRRITPLLNGGAAQ